MTTLSNGVRVFVDDFLACQDIMGKLKKLYVDVRCFRVKYNYLIIDSSMV